MKPANLARIASLLGESGLVRMKRILTARPARGSYITAAGGARRAAQQRQVAASDCAWHIDDPRPGAGQHHEAPVAGCTMRVWRPRSALPRWSPISDGAYELEDIAAARYHSFFDARAHLRLVLLQPGPDAAKLPRSRCGQRSGARATSTFTSCSGRDRARTGHDVRRTPGHAAQLCGWAGGCVASRPSRTRPRRPTAKDALS